MRIRKEHSAGLIIDIQERLFPSIQENDLLFKNTMLLITGLQILDIPVLASEQYTQGLGFTVTEIRNMFEPALIYEKTAFSCCDDPGIQASLKNLHRKNIIIAGIEAHVCVLQTTVDLLENGYLPVIVEDCIASRKKVDKSIAIERMRQEGALITSYESILFELARVSGTEQFKAISKLVK